MNLKSLLPQVVDIAHKAGEAIMDIYDDVDLETTTKQDKDDFESPLTKADLASDVVIEEGLQKISDYPILSEEGSQDVDGAEVFWLIDPLDGTKEFIHKNGEFTVNIALIKNQEPILGVVYAPAKDLLYVAAQGEGAYKESDNKKQHITAEYKEDVPTIVASRRHNDERTAEYLSKFGEHKLINMGSSLKLCMVAEGKATHYPRMWPTYTWDTAAADAVVRAAGGAVKDLDGKPLSYPPKAQKNPFFIVSVKNA